MSWQFLQLSTGVNCNENGSKSLFLYYVKTWKAYPVKVTLWIHMASLLVFVSSVTHKRFNGAKQQSC